MTRHTLEHASSLFSTRKIFITALPVLLSLVLEQLIGLTDVIFLGHYGQTELAAAGVASVFFLIPLMIGYGYSVSSQSLMSRANGAGNLSEIGQVFSQSLFFLISASLVVMTLCLSCIDWLLGKMVDNPSVLTASASYIHWRSLSLPFAYACILIRAFFVAILSPKVLTYSSIVMVMSNCVLNGLLIFGWGPIPEMGIAGAAIASAISEGICLLFLLGYLVAIGHIKTYGLVKKLKPDWLLQLKLFRMGRWLILQEMIAFTSWLYFFIAIEHFGEEQLAVANAVRQMGSIIFLVIHALGSTCGSIAANLYGAERYDEINAVCRRGLLLSYGILIPVGLFMLFFPELVMSVVTNIPGVITNSKHTLWMMVIGYVALLASYHYFYIIGAMGFTKESSMMSLACVIVYVISIFFLSDMTRSVAVMWTTDWIYSIVLGIGGAIVWKRMKWNRKQ